VYRRPRPVRFFRSCFRFETEPTVPPRTDFGFILNETLKMKGVDTDLLLATVHSALDFSLVFVIFLMYYPTAMLGCLCVTFRLQNTMCVYQWQDVRLLRNSPGFLIC
jgi:hypothetical protein